MNRLDHELAYDIRVVPGWRSRRRAGIATLARRRGLAAWWVADDRSLEMTAAGRLRTIWAADEGS